MANYSNKFSVNHKSAMQWAICSPPLLAIQGASSAHYWPSCQWFQELWDTAELPDEVHLDHEVTANLPIGHYFELLVRNFFEYHPKWRVVSSQIILTAEGKTLGECDLVLEELSSQTYFHLEMACKYFLSSDQHSDWESWKGRNTSDTLGGKIAKLETQAGLLNSPDGRLWLQQHHLPRVKSMIWLKGFLFVPLASLLQPKLPRWHHDNVAVGWFLPLASLVQWPESTKQWILLPKEWWIVMPQLPFSLVEEDLLTMAEIFESLTTTFSNSKQRGWLIAQVAEVDQMAKELNRGMIVDDSWPKTRKN